MTTELPNELIAMILNTAELSIDTRLAFKNYIAPCAVTVPEGLADKLAVMHKRRTERYIRYKELMEENSFRWSTSLELTAPIKIDNNTFIEISVSDFGGDGIEMSLKTTRLCNSRNWSLSISTVTCDLHTGKDMNNEFN